MYYAYKYHSAVVVKCIYETEQFMDDHSIRDGVKELHEGIDLDQPVSSFQCTYCKKCFSSRGNLNKHHKKIHSENDSTAENVTGFAKRGRIRAFINIEKSRFEILITVYLDNAWCLVYQLLHQSIVIQGNSAGALFDGLLAELPAILDSFFHQYHK